MVRSGKTWAYSDPILSDRIKTHYNCRPHHDCNLLLDDQSIGNIRKLPWFFSCRHRGRNRGRLCRFDVQLRVAVVSDRHCGVRTDHDHHLAHRLGAKFEIHPDFQGGLYANVGSLPAWLSWAQWGSYFRYGFEAFLINQWVPVTEIECGDKNSTVSLFINQSII